MALTKDMMTGYGVQAPNAYIRIRDFKGDEKNVRFNVGVWYNFDAYQGNNSVMEQYSYIVPYTDGLGISQLYEYLKTVNPFIGAVDFVEPEPQPEPEPTPNTANTEIV
jgi:hypothetical protein